MRKGGGQRIRIVCRFGPPSILPGPPSNFNIGPLEKKRALKKMEHPFGKMPPPRWPPVNTWLSNIEPGEYLDGWRPSNTGWQWFFHLTPYHLYLKFFM